MKHELTLEGPAFRLRPLAMGDSAFVLSLRMDEDLSRVLHPVSGRLEDQEAWMRAYE